MPSSVAHDVAAFYVFWFGIDTTQNTVVHYATSQKSVCALENASPRSIAELEQIMVPAARMLPDVLDDLLSLGHVIPFGVYMGHVGFASVLASMTTVLIGSTGAPYLYLWHALHSGKG